MKSLLQKVFVNIIAIFAASSLIGGVQWHQQWLTLFSAALVLSLVNAFVRPFLKILFLPINVIIIYLTPLLVPGFDIVPFTANILGTSLIFNQFFAYIAVSFMLNILTTLTSWLIT